METANNTAYLFHHLQDVRAKVNYISVHEGVFHASATTTDSLFQQSQTTPLKLL